MVQRAGAEPVRGLLQRTVGGLAHHAVDKQAPLLLKRADSLVEFGVEQVGNRMLAGGQVRVGVVQPPEGGQGSADLRDRAAAVSAAQSRHRGGPSAEASASADADELRNIVADT